MCVMVYQKKRACTGIHQIHAYIWRFPKIWGYPFGGPQNKDCSIFGCILGSPYLGDLYIDILYAELCVYIYIYIYTCGFHC